MARKQRRKQASRKARKSRKAKRAKRTRGTSTNVESLRKGYQWLLPDGSIFAKVRFHGKPKGVSPKGSSLILFPHISRFYPHRISKTLSATPAPSPPSTGRCGSDPPPRRCGPGGVVDPALKPHGARMRQKVCWRNLFRDSPVRLSIQQDIDRSRCRRIGVLRRLHRMDQAIPVLLL